MKPQPTRIRVSRADFVALLSYNPSGVPRRQALGVVAYGVVLGALGGVLAGGMVGAVHPAALWSLGLGILSGIISGATIGALGVVLVARLLDWWLPSGDKLIGYSGLARVLLHAGELSFLGALSGGIGGGVGGVFGGIISGALGGMVIGGMLYRMRGLGAILGLLIGAITGTIGGAVGGAMGSL